MGRHRITRITFDRGYEEYPGIERLS